MACGCCSVLLLLLRDAAAACVSLNAEQKVLDDTDVVDAVVVDDVC